MNIITKSRKLIANSIVYFRLSNGWSQEKLAELLGTSPGYISEIENYKRNISCDYIDKLSVLFSVEPNELLIQRAPQRNKRIKRKCV